MKKLAFILGLLIFARPASADDLTGLLRQADLIMRGKTSGSVFSMEIQTKRYSRSFKMVAWEDNRRGDKTLVKILGPALWRGFGTLKVGDQLKLFNPRTHHVTLVGQSMLGDSWMGSHFSNDDLVKETKLAKHFNHRLKKKWQAKTADGKDATFYLLSLSPKPRAPVAWGRIDYQLWRAGDLVMPVRADYFRKAKDKKPTRWMTFGQVKVLGGRKVPTEMKVELASKPGEYTKIVYRKLKFNVEIPSSKFTEQALSH
jgi:hypothetical protein